MTAPKNPPFEYGNQHVEGHVGDVAYDGTQLSQQEALDAIPVVTEDAPDAVFTPPVPVEEKEPVRERVGKALRQNGVSPKILADFIVSVVVFAVLALTGYPITADPVISAFLAKVAGSAAGFLVGPGEVVVDTNKLNPTKE